MTRLLITSLVAVGALALAAPSFAASPSEWVKSADKICARTNAEIAKIPQPTSTKTLIASSGTFLAIGKRQTGDLAKLKRPSGDAAAIAKLIGYYEQQVGVVTGLIAALQQDDKAKVQKLVAQGGALDATAKSLVKKLGAKNCAE